MGSAARGAHWVKCISTGGNIRGVALDATELVAQIAKTHGLGQSGTRSLGEVIMGALLIASYCKAEERVNLNIQASGNVAQALVDAYPDGAVRGYVVERRLSAKERTKLSSSGTGPWGTGLLSVLRTKGSDRPKQPYIGTVPLITGFIAKDLSFYWAQSEQIPSAVGLVVNVGKSGVTSAGGFLVQAMPGATPEEVKTIESHINDIQSFEKMIRDDSDPLHLLSQIFQSTAFMIVEERPLVFRCECSWERVERALTLVGPKELRSMLQENGEAIVRCDFCSKEYQVKAEDLERLITTLKS